MAQIEPKTTRTKNGADCTEKLLVPKNGAGCIEQLLLPKMAQIVPNNYSYQK